MSEDPQSSKNKSTPHSLTMGQHFYKLPPDCITVRLIPTQKNFHDKLQMIPPVTEEIGLLPLLKLN